MKQQGAFADNDNIQSLQAYLTAIQEMGEFDHKKDQPFLSFLSCVLDITIIKPLIESCTGTEWITGEDLTETERGLKAVFAVVDLVTLGGAVAATKVAGLGAKGALSAAGKTLLSELTANTAAYAAGGIGQELDLPMPLTLLLSAAAGLAAGGAANRALLNKGVGAVDGVNEGGSETLILSTEDAEEIAFNAIKGRNKADAIVLGKYGDGGPTAYTSVAKDIDAQYFQLDNWDELASKYSDNEIWKINEKFLDIQTSSGREIHLSHNPADYIGDGSFYSKEIQYLLDNGYAFVDEGGIWHAVR